MEQKAINYLYTLHALAQKKKSVSAMTNDILDSVVTYTKSHAAAVFLYKKESIRLFQIKADKSVATIVENLPLAFDDITIAYDDPVNAIAKTIQTKRVQQGSTITSFLPPILHAPFLYMQSYLGIREMYAFPLEIRGRCIGCFVLYRQNTLSKEEKNLMALIATLIGTNIELVLQEDKIQKYALEVAQTAVLREKILTMVSHELRTPVAIVKSALSMIDDYDDKSHYLLYAKQGVERQALLVNNLLHEQVIKAEVFVLLKTQCNVTAMLEKVIEELQYLAKAKAIDLILDSQSTIWREVDEIKLSQVFYNLILNAIEHTEKGYVKIQARQESSKVFIDVIDTGKGMSQKEQRNIFSETFHQTKTSIISGLGLYIASYIVKAHGGGIQVESKKGHGTIFHITL